MRLARSRARGIFLPKTEGMSMSKISEKLKAVAAAVAAIEKQFGRGALMQLGGDAIEQKVPVIPSGSVGLDKAFGIGGYPRGRVVEIFGNESSGKTTGACPGFELRAPVGSAD